MEYNYTVKYDGSGALGTDSFMVRSPFKLLVRVYNYDGRFNAAAR